MSVTIGDGVRVSHLLLLEELLYFNHTGKYIEYALAAAWAGNAVLEFYARR